MTTPAQLVADAGRLLYGDAWQSPLARDLGLNLRTVQRIASAASAAESYPVAPGVLADLAGLLDERARDCLTLAGRLRG